MLRVNDERKTTRVSVIHIVKYELRINMAATGLKNNKIRH